MLAGLFQLHQLDSSHCGLAWGLDFRLGPIDALIGFDPLIQRLDLGHDLDALFNGLVKGFDLLQALGVVLFLRADFIHLS